MSSTIDYVKKDLPSGVLRLGIILTIIGLVAIGAAYFTDSARAAFNNVILLMFLVSIGLGSLFLINIEYVAGAVWATPFRRIPEILSGLLIIIPIVALPAFLNMESIFHWARPEAVQSSHLLHEKAPYLNQSFFIIRNLVFYGIWILFFLLLIKNSLKQDSNGDQKLTGRNIKLSAVFIPIFALTITFSSIDWLMSLEPKWFSTIFGVYYFSGTFLAALAAVTFIVVHFSQKGYFFEKLNKDHYYSFGALLFGFVNFWAYIAFSQFLLIWYADMPEETFWFMNRWQEPWMYVSILLVIVQFIVPYAALLSQPSKMNPKNLKFISIWIIFAHLLDLYWLTMPTYSLDSLPFGWMEIGFVISAFGIIILFFALGAKKVNLMPIGDPKLKRGIDFHL